MEKPRLNRFWLLAFGSGGIVLCLLGAALVFLSSDTVGTHPLFGKIRATTAFDLNETATNPIVQFLRKHLPANLVRSSFFPARFKGQAKLLEINGTPMEWSIGSRTTGWLYFKADWEFAPASEKSLSEVTVRSLPTRFYGSNDAELQRAFGITSNSNALNVIDGQVLFARRKDRTNEVYALHLVERDGNNLLVHYCLSSR